MMMHELSLGEGPEGTASELRRDGVGKNTECTVGPSRDPLLTLHHIPVYRSALALSACHCLPLTLRVFVSK